MLKRMGGSLGPQGTLLFLLQQDNMASLAVLWHMIRLYYSLENKKETEATSDYQKLN